MKLETQKIIGKEILFFVSSIVLTFLIWLSLTLYNGYEKYHFNNLEIEINQKRIIKDSLDFSLSLTKEKTSTIKKNIFIQYVYIKGGIGDSGDIPPSSETPTSSFIDDIITPDPLLKYGGRTIPTPFEILGGNNVKIYKNYNDIKYNHKYYKENDPLRV